MPSPTLSDTPTPTSTTKPTPTRIPDPTLDPTLPNLLDNPDFEGAARPVIFGEVFVVEGWEPFYCDTPYTPEQCPALRLGEGNPLDLVMGRPEFRPTRLADRVHTGGQAQQWFCFMRPCRAGVYQVVEGVTPGAWCEVGAMVQTWSSDGAGYTSQTATADQRANSTWFIKIAQNGDTFAFSDHVLVSQGFGFEHGHYDHYVPIRFGFWANNDTITVFFENLRLWPITNNDSYIDDAFVRCER